MTSTNDGNDVNINQRSGHRNKSFYIELYKSLEARLNGESSLEARTAHVCEAWRRVYSLYQHSASSTHPHLFSWLQRHTAHTVLQSKWAESKNDHVRLTAAIDDLVAEVKAAAAGRDLQPWEQLLLQRAEWFKKALLNPWGHPVLKSLINPKGDPVTDQQVLEWLIEERGIVLVTRIRQLVAAGNCDDLALLLASAVMDRARADDKRNVNDNHDKAEPEEHSTSFVGVLEREASFTVDVWDLLKDIELVLLLKTDKQQRCIELAKLTPLRYGYTTIERLCSRLQNSPRDKKLWKHANEVATLVTQVIIARCMVLPQCSGVGRAALYCCARSLARQVAAARLPAVSNTLAAAAATARHLHTFCTALDAECSSDMKPFICELYIRAITAGMNELEQLKLKNDETVGSFSQMLANWFTQLGTLLERSLRLRAECALTAFSVYPAQNYYERVAEMPQPHNISTTQDPTPETTSEFGSWANDSRTQSNLVKTSETLQLKQTEQHQANVLSTAVLTEGETLGLEPELCQDLAVLLSGPRVKTLSWDMDRKVLLENCRSYMDRTQGGTRAVTTELKYLNLDPSEYCHLPEEDDEETGIEKGYEHELLVEHETPEEIWQDAFFDAELTESANDSEVELQLAKKKIKAPVLFSDDDEDPLSNLADAKKEKKKLAKEKRKEQRSKKTQKRDTSKEPSKERRKDKEKKTKKGSKKDKSDQQITGSLTSLLGMKVTKMSSQVQDGEKRVRKKKERRRDSSAMFSYVSVTDSDYDSQEKLSQVSDNDPNILVDGIFSMDEIKSPERPERRDCDTREPIDNTNVEFKAFGIAKSTVINDIKTRPTVSSPKFSTSDDSDVSRSKSPYLTPNQLTNRHVVSSKVKSSINKLLQFRRNKQRPVSRSPAPTQTPTIPNQTLVGMKIYNPEEVPKVYMNKKQLENISIEGNNLRSKTNEISNNIASQASNEPRTDNKLLNLYNVQKQSHDYNAIHCTPLNVLNENPKVRTEFITSPPKLSLHNSYVNQTPANAHTKYLSPPKIEHTSTQALNLSPQKPIITYPPYHKSMQNLSTANMPELPKKPVLINDPNYQSQQAKNVSQLSPRIISNTCIKPPNNTATSSQHDTKVAHMSVISKGAQNVNSQITNLNDMARYAPHLLNSSAQDVNTMRSEVTKKNVSSSNDMRYSNTYSMKSHSDLTNTMHSLQASKTPPSSRIQNLDTKILQNIHATQQKTEIKTHYQEYLNSLAKSLNPSVSVTNHSIHLNKDVKLTPVANSSTSSLIRKIDCATPQCAKQLIQQKKTESAPNTFSRRSYMHKNKQNETKIMNDIISSKLDKNIISHKLMKAQMKNDVTISRVSMCNTNLKNQRKVDSVEQPPKNLQKSCPLLTSMLDSPRKIYEKNPAFTNNATSSQSLTEKQTDREHADLLLLLRQQPIVKANPSTNVSIKSDVTSNHLPSNTHTKLEPQITSAHQTLIGTKVKNINMIAHQVENQTQQHNATNWEDVMDALLAHKTEPLGPNALDMVLKNDKRRSQSSSRSYSQKPRTSGHSSQIKPDPKKRVNHDTKSKIAIFKPNTEKHFEAPKRHRQPEANKKTAAIEMVKRPEIQIKPLSSKEDPFISGIPNSAYDMIGDLMDDDLRRELGELSSDEDAYNSANVSVIKGKCSNIAKSGTNMCKIPNIPKENPHVVNPKVIICKNETKNRVNRKTSSTTGSPTVITTNSSHTNAPRLPENRTVDCSVEQQHTSVVSNQITQSNIDMTNRIIGPNHFVNNVEPANVIIASIPVQAPPVFVIRQDLTYDPYPTIRIHESQVSAGLCSVNQNLYTINSPPNIAVYQTTQFAAPVINPVIIGNAMTSTTVSDAVAMTEQQSSPDTKTDDIKHSTQERIDSSIVDRITESNKSPEKTTNLDFNMNKNCERKVLSQMQEKHLNVNIDKDSHIRRLPAEDKPLKSTQDQERIKLKRQFLLNRKISHACDIGPIALSYTPLSTNVKKDKMLQKETLKNGIINSKPKMLNSSNKIETFVPTDSERVDRPQSATNNENIESATKASSAKENKKSNRRWLRSTKKSESILSSVKRARVPLRRNKIKQKVNKKSIQNATDLIKENKHSVKTVKRVSTRILNKNKLNSPDFSTSTPGQEQQMENDVPVDTEYVTPLSTKDEETVLDNTELIDFEEELSGSKILKTHLLETMAAHNQEIDCEISNEIQSENDEPLSIISKIKNNLKNTEESEVLAESNKSTKEYKDPTEVIEMLKNQLGNQLIIKSLPGQKAPVDRNVMLIKNNAIVKPKKRTILLADSIIQVKNIDKTKVDINRKYLSISPKDSPLVEAENQSQILTNNEVLNSKKTLSASSTSSNNSTISRTDDKIEPNKRNTRAVLLAQKETVPNSIKVIDTDRVKNASGAANTNITTISEKDSLLVMDKSKKLPESKKKQLSNSDIDKIKSPCLDKNKSRQVKVVTRSLLRREETEEVFCTEGYSNTYAHDEETSVREFIDCEPNNIDQKLNMNNKSVNIPKNTVEPKTDVLINSVKLGDANNEVNECRELNKDNVKIEELPSNGANPNSKTVRITLPNGKVLKATISGKINGDFDSLFSQPTMRSILEAGLKDGKRYTVKYTQVSKVNKENPSNILATKIQDMKIRDLTPVDTVNLISDDENEIDTPRTFVTEFGKYTTNVDEISFTEHQKKFSQKCEVKLRKTLVVDNNATKLQTSLQAGSTEQNSAPVTRTRSRVSNNSQTTANNVIPKSKTNNESIPVCVHLTDISPIPLSLQSTTNSLNSNESKLLAVATTTSDMTVECNIKNYDVSLTTADTTINSTPGNKICTTFPSSEPKMCVQYSATEAYPNEPESNATNFIPEVNYSTNDNLTVAPTLSAPSEHSNNTSKVVNTKEIDDTNTDVFMTEQRTPTPSEEVFNETPRLENTTEIPVFDNADKLLAEQITPSPPMEVSNDDLNKVDITEIPGISDTYKSVPEQTPGSLVEGSNDSSNLVNALEVLVDYNTDKSMPIQIIPSSPEEVCNDILKEANTTEDKEIIPTLLMEVTEDSPIAVNTTEVEQINNTNADKLITENVACSPSVEISNDTLKEVNVSGVKEIIPSPSMKVSNITPMLKTTGVEMDTSNGEKLKPEKTILSPHAEVFNDTPKVLNTIETVEIDQSIPKEITPSPSVQISNDYTLKEVDTTEVVELNHSNTDKSMPDKITPIPATEAYNDTLKKNTTEDAELHNSNTDNVIKQILSPSVEVSNDNQKVVNTVEVPEIDKSYSDNLTPKQTTNKINIPEEMSTTHVVEIDDTNAEELVPNQITPSPSLEISSNTSKAVETSEVIEIDDSSNDSVEIVTADESVEPVKKIFALTDMLLQEFGIKPTNESNACPRKKKAAVYDFKNALLQDLGIVPTLTPVIDITNDDDDVDIPPPKRPVLTKCFVKMTRCDNLITKYKLMKRCYVKLERLDTIKMARAKSEASTNVTEQCNQDNGEDLIEFDVEETSVTPQLSRCPSLSILNDWDICHMSPEIECPSSPVMEIFDTLVQLRNDLTDQRKSVGEIKELFSLKCDSEWTMTKFAFRAIQQITRSFITQAVPLTECSNMKNDDKMLLFTAPNLLTITLELLEANPDLIYRLHSTRTLSNKLINSSNKLKRKTGRGSDGTIANKIIKLGTLALNVWNSSHQIMEAYKKSSKSVMKGKEHEIYVHGDDTESTNGLCDITTEFDHDVSQQSVDSAFTTEIDTKTQNTRDKDLKKHENHPVLIFTDNNTHANKIIVEHIQNDKISDDQVSSHIEDKKVDSIEIMKNQSDNIETDEEHTDSHIVDAPVTDKNYLTHIDADKNQSGIKNLNDSSVNIPAISEKTFNLDNLNPTTINDIEQLGSEKTKNYAVKSQLSATNKTISEDIVIIEKSDSDVEQDESNSINNDKEEDSRANSPSLLENFSEYVSEEIEQRNKTDSIEEANPESLNTINLVDIARLNEIAVEDLSDEAYLVEIVVSNEEDEADIIQSIIDCNQELSPVNVDNSRNHNSSLKSPVFIDSNNIIFNYHDYTKKPTTKENVTNTGDLSEKENASEEVEIIYKTDSNIDLNDHSKMNYYSENLQPKAKSERKYELIQEDDLLTVITTENDKEDDEINPAFENSNDSLEENTSIIASVCSINDSINIKGYEYDDVYVFPLSETGSNSNASSDSINQEFNISVNKRLSDVKNELHDMDFGVIEPRVTYTRKSLKRKIGMKDVKVLEKKYRKGKNIDCPKQTFTSIIESAYSKEYKRLLEYCSSVKFSYSRPFHKECVEVDNLVNEWPINGSCDGIGDDVVDEDLFRNLEQIDSFQPDPATQTLAEEISYGYEFNVAIQENPSSEAGETNFNMGFGEGSGRVIQILKKEEESNISAATLSDVKQSQPVLKSVDFDDSNNLKTSEDDLIKKIRQHVSFIELRDKVRTFFKKCSFELKYDWIQQNIKDLNSTNNDRFHAEQFPFDLCSLEYVKPMPTETIVQVVQVGQLPVSAAAQNPVTCDPRVTQVSDASPSQCSVDNSPNDDSQSEIKTEYTELTTADLTLPLQEYAQQNQAMNLTSHDDNIELREQTISLEMEIKAEESPEIKEEIPDIKDEKSNSSDTELHTLTNAKPENMEYAYKNNNDKSETGSVIYESTEQNESETFPQQRQQNGTSEKTDQIAHAMNAAGITTTPETVTNTRAHALVNILSQKIRHGSVNTTQTATNTYSKTTSINAMALQQALAQILPPPLNQTGSGENNQASSTPVGPQVLHIVQGKNATGNQITLVDNSQQSVISAPNTQVLHIVQNKGAASGQASNGTLTPQNNSFSGLSLVDAGLQQGGNQLLHIVNTGNQKNASPGQLLKRVNLLTNLTNVQGSNEQKMVQFVCKSADGKAIQLNAPHQRSMVLRLQPIESPNVQASAKPAESQELSQSPTSSASKESASQQEIKSRSIYEENYAKFIQNSSTKTSGLEKSTSLPKFNQAFGKPVFQEGSQKQGEATSNNLQTVNTNTENAECPANDNAINLEHIGQISSPPLLLRKQTAVTSQSQSNIVQQIKQTIAPMNIQTMHGGVIYTRQIPVNIGGGQTINLITVPSTDLINDEAPKTQTQTNQGEIEPSIIKIVPQNQNTTTTESSQEDSNNQSNGSNENAQTPQPQPVLTQMRIKLPMLSKAPQMVPGARVVRPSFFQIQRNVIGGANQPVYQQLVLTAAPPLGQQTIRLPTAQASRTIKVHSDSQSSSSESQMSSSTLEQLREFDMVLEQVKERSTVQPGANSNSNFKIHNSSSDTTDGNASSNCSTESTPQQVLYSIGSNQSLNVAYVNRKATVTTSTTSTYVRSPDSSGIADSPTSSTHGQIPHTVTSDSSPTEMSSQSKPAKVGSKSKSRPKSTSNPPNTLKLNSVPPKTSSQKPLEDEQTTQRILYILAEYKEQVENSPDKDKPAPRRRSNPPSNPGSSKRKKSSSSRRSGTRDMSPVHGEDTCRTMGSEDSSCGTSQGDCNESCLDSHSPQDSPRKVARKITFDQDLNVTQPRPQPQRNVIVADGQTITVARGTTGKPATAVLMPANYILPVSMVKGGQQIAIVTNRGPKLLTVGGEGGATNALLLQRLIGPAGLKPVLARPGVRHVRLPTAALHNLQAFNLATATTVQPPDSTASPTPGPTPPELVDTRATSSPWTDRGDSHDVKPERGSSPEGSEPWNLPSSADHEYTYEETVRTDNMDRTVLVVQKKDGSQRQHRIAHVSAAALRHKYAILEHELRLQKSLSEECEDLGVDSPSASELFPEAELLFAASPAHEHTQDQHHSHTPQPLQSTIPQPDMDDQIATDHLIPREIDVSLGLGDVGIVAVSGEGMQTITLDQEEFARAHPNTTFHSEPTDGEVQPFTITGLKGRHITSTIFHSNSAPATVLMAAPQATVISQAPDHGVKYEIENMINSMPSSHNNDINLSSVLVKDDGLTRFDNILTDSRELHLTNTASAIVHSSGNATQVIRRVCYEEDKRERDTRFLIDEPDNLIAGDDAKMIAEDSSRDATLESMADVDDDRSSPERHAELFWESNSASERSESRRPLDFSSDSDKCCKSPSFDETNSTDSSGVGTHMRLDSVIKEARGRDRSGSADGSSADDTHPPLRTYPPKRMYHPLEGEVERSLSGKTRAGERSPDSLEVRRRASGRGVVKRGCHCCNGSPAPPRPKKPRQRKPTLDFTTNN